MGGRVSEVDDAYAWRLLRVRFTRPCALSLEAPIASYSPATRHLFLCVPNDTSESGLPGADA